MTPEWAKPVSEERSDEGQSQQSQQLSYYGRPVLKAPVWTWEVPAYFFTGGLAGASSALALAARLSGHQRVAITGQRVAAAAAVASPPLLMSDLGRPSRFANMLRVLKPTSPMSVGSWLLAGYAPLAVGTAVLEETGKAPRLRLATGALAAVAGPALATYTAVLVSTTAVPAWADAGRELPFLFAGSALASAGAATTALVPPAGAGPARRALLAGAALELAAEQAVTRRLDPEVARPYHEGTSGRLMGAARALTVAGAGLVAATGRRQRRAAIAGAGLTLAGSACQRFGVVEAGRASARDPGATIGPQRRRLT